MPKVSQPKHGRKAGTKSLWICEYCEKDLSSSSALKDHRRIHTRERPFRCNLCGYSAAHKSDLQSHIRRHLQEKLFKCPEPGCNYSFVRSSNLKAHQLVHTREKPFSCPHSSCSYKTGQKGNLTRHMETHQKNRDQENRAKPFQCESCPFTTTTGQNLKRHITNIHTTEKRFKCAEEGCNSAFKTKGVLAQHVQIHREKMLSCPHPNCEYRTNGQQKLKGHMKIHSVDKRHKCRICAYAAHESSHLVRHVRTHTKERPFKCSVVGCSYEAKTSSALKSHVKSVHASAEKRLLEKHQITQNPDSRST